MALSILIRDVFPVSDAARNRSQAYGLTLGARSSEQLLLEVRKKVHWDSPAIVSGCKAETLPCSVALSLLAAESPNLGTPLVSQLQL